MSAITKYNHTHQHASTLLQNITHGYLLLLQKSLPISKRLLTEIHIRSQDSQDWTQGHSFIQTVIRTQGLTSKIQN